MRQRVGKKAVGAVRSPLEERGVVGHWMKMGWGAYFKASKRRRVPRLPGM